MEKMLADLKKRLATVDKESIEKLKNSKDRESRKLAAMLQKKLDDDTGMMLQVSPGYGRRIGASGKAEGPVLEKAPSGLYISEKEIEDEKKREARRGSTNKTDAPKKKEEKMDAATRRAMNNMADKEKRRKMGERYDAIMPSPEPGEAVPRQKKKDGGAVMKYAKGGVVKAACGASVPPAQKRK